MNNAVNEAREKLGLSVSEMARILGVHRNNVDQWCRGERNPPAIALTAIAMMVFMAERGLLDEWKTHQQP
ncbi:helix-turn-helix transcriptional regulator [Xenorhabdus bovienii]|uniref:helix-turn-helix domain-containing protein n=1 Tax=Xenorhabdus bovienii TaxID=40576 RepID=UPI0023AF18ED|nr:helix-turn-helix transcriptional regulator [Xenorhabdus bovienii]MDE9477042.1 helix-turn-helix transcriptional regulator [Xenorhabdus bovienii]MDE9484465.1 helix-turn-helix transcriptional regulator [Xenorhabdus bovienii]MDE9530022.1 helix-turn-helix transcriptional regulator [Xenorhabdus bovienii]MDE9557022.1 helix-turn-helix transcriptional regulator [Xenorhabdus bovienii]MDE9588232.1 helix-turn-helix transcriptional regulator [Xenorhabdus bovienii]